MMRIASINLTTVVQGGFCLLPKRQNLVINQTLAELVTVLGEVFAWRSALGREINGGDSKKITCLGCSCCG